MRGAAVRTDAMWSIFSYSDYYLIFRLFCMLDVLIAFLFFCTALASLEGKVMGSRSILEIEFPPEEIHFFGSPFSAETVRARFEIVSV